MTIRADKNTLLGLLALLLWSTTIATARSLAEALGPITAGAAVCMLGGALGLIARLPRGNPVSQFLALPRRYIIGCGALFIIYTVCLYAAIGLAADRSQVLAVGLLNYLWPTLTILFSLPLLRRRARVGLLPGTLLALFGIFLVRMHGADVSIRSLVSSLSSSPLVFALGLGAAISWALYSNLARLWGGKNSDGAVPAFILATGIVLLCIRMLRPEVSIFSVRAAAEVVFLSTATALAYVFWDVAMRKGNAVFVVACSYLLPLLSTAISCAYLAVMPGASLWLGCLLIIGGSVLSRLSVEEKPAAPAPSSPQSISP